jgi:hypothetical protein
VSGNLVILPLRVRPAMGEREAGPVAREDLIHREAIDHSGAAGAAQHLAAVLSRLAGQNPIERDGGRVHTPHGTGRGRRPAESRPARLIDIDHRRGERALPERLGGRLEMPREGVQLIPERLRVHAQALAGHHVDLSLEWAVIHVFRHGDAHGERRCVAAPGDQLGRPGAVTTAPLHAQRYFCRMCRSTWYVSLIVVIRSDVSLARPFH